MSTSRPRGSAKLDAASGHLRSRDRDTHPDLPPTPPIHSLGTGTISQAAPPATPPSRREPPTPDVTPPVQPGRAWVHADRGMAQLQPHSQASGATFRRRTELALAEEKQHVAPLGRAPSAPVKPTRSSVQTVQTEIQWRKASIASTASMSSTQHSASEAPRTDGTDGPPQRQRTLRHVRKKSALREPREVHPREHEQDSIQSPRPPPPQLAHSIRSDALSVLSAHTSRSIASSRARREIWNSGAIPVVVVPERSSSQGPRSRSREPSLRSVDSKRSRQTGSAISASGPVFERRPFRRDRRNSEPDRLDERTADFPPTVPVRSSSLSAPTSRTASRAPSIRSTTASNTKTRGKNAIPLEDDQSRALMDPLSSTSAQQEQEPARCEVTLIDPDPQPAQASPAPVVESRARHSDLAGGGGGGGEPLSPPFLPPSKTPLSVPSLETCITAPELSEALAVHMYQHQNSSILLVNNSGRPSVFLRTLSSDVPVPVPVPAPRVAPLAPFAPQMPQSQPHRNHEEVFLSPRARMMRTVAVEKSPSTPPQKKPKLLDADSPLRNPRAPPQPPKDPNPDQGSPALDSTAVMGRTSRRERLGRQDRPPRQLDLVKRALSRRRQSIDVAFPGTNAGPGFLTRTFSLSRSRKGAEEKGNGDGNLDVEGGEDMISAQETTEETKLPLWQPELSKYPADDVKVVDYDGGRYGCDDETAVVFYPPVDNRPTEAAPSRRRRRRRDSSLSASGRLTPITPPAQEFTVSIESPFPQRYLRSAGSFRHSPPLPLRRRTLSLRQSTSRPSRGIWRSPSVGSDAASGMGIKMKRRFSIGSRIEDIQNIPHMIREKRREKRTQKLRLMISGPREVHDGVGEVIRRSRAYQHYPVTHI